VNFKESDFRAVRKFTLQDATDWMEWSGIALADVVNEDETPAAKLGGVGFLRAPKARTAASNSLMTRCWWSPGGAARWPAEPPK
jgi:hypothetical protein